MVAPAKLSDAEFRALGALAKARKDNLAGLFRGTHLAFGRHARESAAVSLLKKGRAVHKEATSFGARSKDSGGVLKAALQASKGSSLGTMKQLGKEFIGICMDCEEFTDVVEALGMEVVEELAGELVPYLTVLTSGYKSAKAWRGVYQDATNLYRSRYWVRGVLPGDPLAAAEAVQVIIQRDLTRHTIDATRETAMLGAKIGSLFVDYGAGVSSAIGLANASMTLALELASIGIDYWEMKAGNKLLEQPGGITLEVFNASPLLGCYLITCSDDSMLANFFVADIGLPGWMDKVEQIKKKQLGPLQKVASQAIQKSRIELVGIESNKGMIKEKGVLDLARSKVANAAHNFGKAVKARL